LEIAHLTDEEILIRTNDEGWNQTPRPQPQPEDVNEDSNPQGEQDQTSRLTQTEAENLIFYLGSASANTMRFGINFESSAVLPSWLSI